MKLPELKSFKNIAIVQTAFLGDVVLALPLAQTIRNFHPDCQISFITTPAASSLVASAKAVDTIITYDKKGLQTGWRGIKFLAESLKEKHIDCVISPHRSFRTTLLTYLSRPDYSVGFSKNAFSVHYDKRIEYQTNLHEIDRNISLLSAFSDFSQITKTYDVEIDVSNSDKSFIDSKLGWLGIKNFDKLVAIAPGSIWETKKWKEEHFAELAVLLRENGSDVVFIGSEDDKELCRRLSENSGCHSLAGETSLPQTLYFLSLCKLTITNDSAPTHLAGLMKCPTITIFGPTSPKFGFAPRGPQDKSIEIEYLSCKPCAIHGGDLCPKKTHNCMILLKSERIYDEAVKLLQ